MSWLKLHTQKNNKNKKQRTSEIKIAMSWPIRKFKTSFKTAFGDFLLFFTLDALTLSIMLPIKFQEACWSTLLSISVVIANNFFLLIFYFVKRGCLRLNNLISSTFHNKSLPFFDCFALSHDWYSRTFFAFNSIVSNNFLSHFIDIIVFLIMPKNLKFVNIEKCKVLNLNNFKVNLICEDVIIFRFFCSLFENDTVTLRMINWKNIN